jgi:dynein heavy chain, axonemal
MMGAMRDIRVRDERTQQLFQPLKETVALLKQYNVPIKDETIAQLDDGPMKWKALDKKKKQRTEALNAKVIAEQIEVRRRSDAFQKNVDTFSDHFQATAPFHVKARSHASVLRPLTTHAATSAHAPPLWTDCRHGRALQQTQTCVAEW